MKVKTLADMDEIETQVHAALVGYEFGRFLNMMNTCFVRRTLYIILM